MQSSRMNTLNGSISLVSTIIKHSSIITCGVNALLVTVVYIHDDLKSVTLCVWLNSPPRVIQSLSASSDFRGKGIGPPSRERDLIGECVRRNVTTESVMLMHCHWISGRHESSLNWVLKWSYRSTCWQVPQPFYYRNACQISERWDIPKFISLFWNFARSSGETSHHLLVHITDGNALWYNVYPIRGPSH